MNPLLILSAEGRNATRNMPDDDKQALECLIKAFNTELSSFLSASTARRVIISEAIRKIRDEDVAKYPQLIIEEATKYFDCSRDELLNKNRHQRNVSKKIAVSAVLRAAGLLVTEVSQVMGYKEHAAILYHLSRAQTALDYKSPVFNQPVNKEIRRYIQDISANCESNYGLKMDFSRIFTKYSKDRV